MTGATINSEFMVAPEGTVTLFDERDDALIAIRVAELAAKSIQRVRESYGKDLNRIELMAAGPAREALLETYGVVYRELGRAATIASTGRDPGDAGGFGGDAE